MIIHISVCFVFLYILMQHKDGTMGGYCSSDILCTTTGSGCKPETNTCTDCTVPGYHIVESYCKQDRVFGGYCDTNAVCIDGTACDFESSVCINCSSIGYRVLPDGYCRQDGMIDGYCDKEIPCLTFAAGCLHGFNICVICYAGNTLIDGYCIEDEAPESQTVDTDSNAGIIAGIVITGFIIGVAINGIIYIIVLQKLLVAKTGYAPQNMKEIFLAAFK